jgi:hypothetical protein
VEIEETVIPSIEGLQQIEFVKGENLFVSSFYTCTSGTGLGTGKSEYYATCKFTKKELPVGTVIEIADGWMYRPEYWENDVKAKSRPSVTSTYRIVITEDFWDTECHRAFNISTILKDTLKAEAWDDVVNAFKIYVPKSSTLYTADK